jgi:hypothetical protein
VLARRISLAPFSQLVFEVDQDMHSTPRLDETKTLKRTATLNQANKTATKPT